MSYDNGFIRLLRSDEVGPLGENIWHVEFEVGRTGNFDSMGFDNEYEARQFIAMNLAPRKEPRYELIEEWNVINYVRREEIEDAT